MTIPIRPDLEAGLWYFYYYLTQRGRAGLTANRSEIAKVIWKRNCMADGNFPAGDGTASAHHFSGPRAHHQVPNAGHNLPQEAPDAFASAVLVVQKLGEAQTVRQ